MWVLCFQKNVCLVELGHILSMHAVNHGNHVLGKEAV